MTAPMRISAGFTQDLKFQPLGHLGIPNPAFYHQYFDDFDFVDTNRYTTTANTNGTVAVAAGDGGLALFTTNASTPLATDIVSIQLKAAGFTIEAGKKMAFLTRLQVSSASLAAFLVGLIETSTTPFAPTDGIYFSKATGGTALELIHSKGSTDTSVVVPTAAYSLADATNIDLGWYYDGRSSIWAFAGLPLVGQVQNQNAAPLGPVAVLDPAALSTSNLSLTLAVQSGTAASHTMTVDFAFVAKER